MTVPVLDPEPEPEHFWPRPEQGRVFSGQRAVRMADVTPTGRLRLDALARYLGDVAEDDVDDIGWDEPVGWVLRRSVVTIDRFPTLGDTVSLDTFCTGTAPRWAERTTTVADSAGDAVQVRALWVAVDLETGRPVRLGPSFEAIYGPAAGGRRATARLTLPEPPGDVAVVPWPVRAVDLDLWGHVNNAVHWAAVEEVLAGDPWRPRRAVIEYNEPILPTARLGLAERPIEGGLDLWLLDGRRRLSAVRLEG
jgi:acyl-ACP thioesterase